MQDKSRCQDNRVRLKSCNIVKYKRGHVSFVCLHMKGANTKMLETFPEIKHFDRVSNELLLT